MIQQNEVGTQTGLFDLHFNESQDSYFKIAKIEDVKLDHTYYMYDEELMSPLEASTPDAHYKSKSVVTHAKIMEDIMTSPEVEPLSVVSPGSSGCPTP